MQRSLVFALVLVLALVGGLCWLFLRGDVSPPPAPGPTGTTAAATPVAESSSGAVVAGDASLHTGDREVVAMRPADPIDDPDIQAGLTGFRGRVVTHAKAPVADCGVRIYRGAMDSMLQVGTDIFAETPYVPQVVAGETRTASDGTFVIGGVWPRAFYLLFAGIGTDAPTHQIVTRTPSPGEIVDLGDVVLTDAGILVGTVLDENGDPLPGALVRCADLPGALAGLFPLERFDPDGALLARDGGLPIKVVEMPPWVKPLFDQLPIPTDLTDSDGRFRLVGVTPGSNMVATTQRGYLSDVKASVQVKAGQTKDVGKIKLKRGEELLGRVVDTAGKPIADAEILAGSTLSIGPIDLAQKLGRSDADGRFQGHGFAPGKVTVAARRGKGHTWVLADPQPVIGEVTVVLPALFGAVVSVALADGKPALEPRFRLLQGSAGNGAAEMALLGFVPPIDLRDRREALGEGRWRITNLLAGSYTLVADAPGHAAGFATFTVQDADAAVELKLTPSQHYTVVVLGAEDKPVRNAAIYAQPTQRKLMDMPLLCGRTGTDGRLRIDSMQGEQLRVSADHPRWGVVHGEVKVDEELVLRMQPPGTLTGLLSENGKPAPAGQYTVTVERRRGANEPRGPIETVPLMLTPGLDGTFVAKALQPGSYRVGVIRSLDALRSPGGVFALAQEMFVARDLPRETVELAAGGTAEVRLETGQKPIDGPTATLAGSLTIDGKVGVGHFVTAQAKDRRFSARTDQAGRFDLGTVPAGTLRVVVMASAEGGFFGGPAANLWQTSLTLAQAEARELAITIATTSIAGVCLRPDGSPAAGTYVQASGTIAGVGKEQGQVRLGSPTDSQGRFSFAQVAEGKWTLEVRGDEGQRGRIENLEVVAGSPRDDIRIDLQQGMLVKGRVDLSTFGKDKPRWVWIGFYQRPKPGSNQEYGSHVDGVGVDMDTGEFSTGDLEVGEYLIQIHANRENKQTSFRGGEVVVPAQGVQDLVLRPGAELR
jgi:hypothetical protein